MNRPEWLSRAVFYEIYPQSFLDTNGDGVGDIRGIINKLDYIQSLGCNAIWMNPCFDSPFMDAGYDVRDYKKVAERYGTNEDLQKLFAEAHKREMRVILDLVIGHTSDQHEWFQESQKAERNTFTDRYIWTDNFQDAPEGLPYISGMSERDGNYILNFFASQPALNFGFNKITAPWQMHYTDPRVAENFESVIEIMRFWLDLGCDGYRVDMAMSLVKNDGLPYEKEGTPCLWRKVMGILDEEYPQAALIAEWGFPEDTVGKDAFHADFCLQHSIGFRSLFHNVDEKTGAQTSYFSKLGKGSMNEFIEPYCETLNKIKGKGYYCLITCNHDTVRLTKYFDETERKIIFSFLFTMPGVPFLYYGDEIGMQYFSLKSKEGGYYRTGSRTPMQWNKDRANMGFSEADPEKLYLPLDPRDCAPSVEEQEQQENSMLNTVRRLLQLRNSDEDLQADGNFEIIYNQASGYPFAYKRGKFTIVMNPSGHETIAEFVIRGKIVYQIGNAEMREGNLHISPQSFIVYREYL